MSQDVLGGLLEESRGLGEARAKSVDHLVQLEYGSRWSGCAKIVRTIAATGSRAECGIVASRFRMKCTRQRCQLAPESTVESALRSPSFHPKSRASPRVARA